jgi:hypothetical protein
VYYQGTLFFAKGTEAGAGGAGTADVGVGGDGTGGEEESWICYGCIGIMDLLWIWNMDL